MGDFVVGANLPWINYGGDFGANAWHPSGGVHTRADDLARALDRVVAAGIARIRWFMLCDGRTGIEFAADGAPLGLDAFVFDDMDAALAAAGERGIEIMFVVIDFLWCARARSIAGVQVGGRRHVLQEPDKRAALFDRILTPIFERYGHHPGIFAWDLINEPEWATCGLGARRRRSCVSLETMRAFVREAAALVHRHTVQAATVGAASARYLDAWRDLGLDVYQVHWYEHLERRAPLGRPVRELALDRPVVLGEFPSRIASHKLRWIIDTARAAGYAEAFIWSVLAHDSATDFAVAEPVLKDNRTA